jgi:DNA-binding transcriptional LysR family regulator
MLGAAVEGVGLAQVPEPIAAELVSAGKLVHVLERFAPMAPGVFLYYADRRQVMPKLRAFIDHVKSRSHATRRVRTKASRLLKPSKALERVKPWSG